ncbi:MAG: GNAT family N-acetyltransferase [Patescibacteria group bacterium]|nr:GNAT family N-acetyltransferase [Patescibacteria group bacterium]
MKIEILKNKKKAVAIGKFITSKAAFEQTWTPDEKRRVQEAPLESLTNPLHQYWYIEDKGQIVGAIGINENKYKNLGFEMDNDYVAIHKKYRREGLGSKLLQKAERFVKMKKGRYIHILSCDIKSYKPARIFFVKNGYKQVANIPNYYVTGEGRIDYIKTFI